jgi:ElaB/YqjD/DUF883 family membrane-anchored ribosome-binding protein
MKTIDRLALKIVLKSIFRGTEEYRHRKHTGDLRDFVRRHYGTSRFSSRSDGFFQKLRRKDRAMEEQAKDIQGEEENEQEGAELMSEMKQLKKDLDSLKSDLKDLTKSVKELGSAKVGDAKAKLWGTATSFEKKVEDSLTGAYDTVRSQGQRYVDAGRDQIQQHPMTSALWIFAAGFIIGKLFDRR